MLREFFAPMRAGLLTVLVSDVDYERCRGYRWRGDDTGASGKPYIKTDIVRDDGARTTMYLHRFITGCPPAYRADHRDNDTLNNQRPNLRITTHDQNNFNRSPWGLSGYKGVTRVRHRFRARITIEHEEKHLGYFASAIDAAEAYDKAAHQLFGEFAWLNFPEHYPAPCHDIITPDIPF
jgi:hypothetical protein